METDAHTENPREHNRRIMADTFRDAAHVFDARIAMEAVAAPENTLERADLELLDRFRGLFHGLAATFAA